VLDFSDKRVFLVPVFGLAIVFCVNTFTFLQNQHTQRFLLSNSMASLDNRTSTVIDNEYSSLCGSFYHCLIGKGEGYARDIDNAGSSYRYIVIDYGYLFFFYANIILFVYVLFRSRFNVYVIYYVAPIMGLFLINHYQRPILFTPFALILLGGVALHRAQRVECRADRH